MSMRLIAGLKRVLPSDESRMRHAAFTCESTAETRRLSVAAIYDGQMIGKILLHALLVRPNGVAKNKSNTRWNEVETIKLLPSLD